MKLLVVESPAKAKTIKKYLGSEYDVVASFGHVRDLPSKTGSVKPDDDFSMDYELSKDGGKHLSNIAKLLKQADTLYLATDPDREGEAISWHIAEALKKQRKLPKSVEVKRVTFNQITKKAILTAIKESREIDMDLVNAQQARRALDYLVGFTLSPILWKKLPGSRSAGRVQSVALRLLCERESEIEAFNSQEYWSINLALLTKKQEDFKAMVVSYKGQKLEKLTIVNEKEATDIVSLAKENEYHVNNIEHSTTRRKPQPPFTTSTLQQEAVKRLGFRTKRAMQIAQKLYEGINIDGQLTGLITYMRTDGVDIGKDAIGDIRGFIESEYGSEYAPKMPVVYQNKIKNAQEAHEAIRPTNFSLKPEAIKMFLDREQYDLYELIWKRTIASQMQPAVINVVKVTIASRDEEILARTSGSTIEFQGFYKVLPPQSKDEQFLPNFSNGDDVKLEDVISKQHFTEPPARFNEASIVKKLEELGIGRPSTYSSIISLLIDRDYARLDKKKFIPQERGRIVTSFLTSFFSKYVEYDFTAKLEEELDEISNGKLLWKKFLGNFWDGFNGQISHVGDKENNEIVEKITDQLAPHFFPENEDGSDSRVCPDCTGGKLFIKTGKFGAFIACNGYPECKYTRQISEVEQDSDVIGNSADKKVGAMEDGSEIFIRKGPYGFYLELLKGEDKKRVTIPKAIEVSAIDFELAKKLIELPRVVGIHPETNEEVKANFGKFGPYFLYQGKFCSAKDVDILEVGINRAVTIIAEHQAKAGSKDGNSVLAELGDHPKTKKPIKILKGRYGSYIKYNNKNFSLPKDESYDSIDQARAIDIINAKKTKK